MSELDGEREKLHSGQETIETIIQNKMPLIKNLYEIVKEERIARGTEN